MDSHSPTRRFVSRRRAVSVTWESYLDLPTTMQFGHSTWTLRPSGCPGERLPHTTGRSASYSRAPRQEGPGMLVVDSIFFVGATRIPGS